MDAKTFELEMSDLAYGGSGIGRSEGFVYFVRGALPGEKIVAEETSRKKNYARAEIVRILRESSGRIPPVCPLAYSPGMRISCPGCSYQHLDYTCEINAKNAQLMSFLKKAFPGFSGERISPPLPSPRQLGYRNKITLHGRNGILGYFAEDNETIIDVPECPLAMEPINRAVAEFRGKGVGGFSGDIVFRFSEAEGVFILYGGDRGGGRIISEKTSIGEFKLPAGSFFQVNPFALEIMLEQVSALLKETGPECLLDLFCGCGIFSILAAKNGIRQTFGIDIDGETTRCAATNAALHGVERKCSFRAGRAEEIFRRNPPALDPSSTMVLLDPPRGGISGRMIEFLLEKKCRWILYVSCAPDILSRDLFRLSPGYSVEKAFLLDMFPRTSQFESVVLCSLKR